MTLVATALCADRAVMASPAARPDDSTPTRTLVGRLTVTLRRCVPSVRLWETRRDQDRPAFALLATPASPLIAPVSLSPFQFRLPPPAV